MKYFIIVLIMVICECRALKSAVYKRFGSWWVLAPKSVVLKSSKTVKSFNVNSEWQLMQIDDPREMMITSNNVIFKETSIPIDRKVNEPNMQGSFQEIDVQDPIVKDYLKIYVTDKAVMPFKISTTKFTTIPSIRGIVLEKYSKDIKKTDVINSIENFHSSVLEQPLEDTKKELAINFINGNIQYVKNFLNQYRDHRSLDGWRYIIEAIENKKAIPYINNVDTGDRTLDLQLACAISHMLVKKKNYAPISKVLSIIVDHKNNEDIILYRSYAKQAEGKIEDAYNEFKQMYEKSTKQEKYVERFTELGSLAGKLSPQDTQEELAIFKKASHIKHNNIPDILAINEEVFAGNRDNSKALQKELYKKGLLEAALHIKSDNYFINANILIDLHRYKEAEETINKISDKEQQIFCKAKLLMKQNLLDDAITLLIGCNAIECKNLIIQIIEMKVLNNEEVHWPQIRKIFVGDTKNKALFDALEQLSNNEKIFPYRLKDVLANPKLIGQKLEDTLKQ